jgi:hypothetical protein
MDRISKLIAEKLQFELAETADMEAFDRVSSPAPPPRTNWRLSRCLGTTS